MSPSTYLWVQVILNPFSPRSKKKESDEYHQDVFVAKNSENIFADAWRTIDMMDSSKNEEVIQDTEREK
ncbi:unnamed protein product [Caenorhabditis brenneri]